MSLTTDSEEVNDDDFFCAITPSSSLQPPRPDSWGRNKSSPSGANSAFRVYNPVDDSFEGWPAESSFENHPSTADSGELDSFRENSSSSHDAVAVSTGNRRRGNEGHNRSLSSSRNTPSESQDDTALARAIAEQDLPPGVSAIEQQEVMMRLLTQQLRRGDWSTGEEGSLSPELEQRLRE
jgi:hypothetical protein